MGAIGIGSRAVRGAGRGLRGRLFAVATGMWVCIAAGGASAAAQIEVGSVSIAAGDAAPIPAELKKAAGTGIAAVSVDVRYDGAAIDDVTCLIDPRIGSGSAANKTLVQSDLAGSGVRIGIVGLNNATIGNGRLFTCTFFTRAAAAPGDYPLAATAGASTSSGSSAPVTASSGVLSLSGAAPSDGDGDGIVFTPGALACAGGIASGCSDNCPSTANASQADADGDGVGDACDLCRDEPDPPTSGGRQLDTDEDGYGNACDCDFTGDGRCTMDDFGIFLSDFSEGVDSGVGSDMNGDGEVSMSDFTLFLGVYSTGQPGASAAAP